MGKNYVCLGSDQAIVTEEEYKKGLTKCGGECTLQGHPFVLGAKCKICGKNYPISAPHNHKKKFS